MAACLLLAAPAQAAAEPTCADLDLATAPIVPDPDGNGTRPPVRFFADVRIPSRDVTLRASLYVPLGASAASPVPAVAMTHGGGGKRQDLDPGPKTDDPDTSNDERLDPRVDGPGNKDLFGVVDGLLTRDYAVLGWDTRGQGQSVSMNGSVPDWFGPVRYHASHPDLEGADARALVDFLSGCPWVRRDDDGPTVGFTGASNGGLQSLVAGAADSRVDAIAPYEASVDVDLDFFPHGLAKEWWNYVYRKKVWSYDAWFLDPGWSFDASRAKAAVAQPFHTEFPKMFATVRKDGSKISRGSGVLTPELRGFLRSVSILDRLDQVQAPTLIVQGTTDTGAPLENAYRIYDKLTSRDAPPEVKVVAACFGHRLDRPPCPYLDDETQRRAHAWRWQEFIFDWMDRHLKRDPLKERGPEFTWEDQDETYRTTTGNPLSGETLTVQGEPMRDNADYTDRRLVWDGAEVSGGDEDMLMLHAPREEQLAYRAGNWFLHHQPPEPAKCRPLVGIPKLRLTGGALRADGRPLSEDGRAFLFAEIIDVASSPYKSGTIHERGVGIALPPTGYETPGPASYNPETGRFDVTVEMPGVAWWAKPGHRLWLQATVGSKFFADPLDRPASEIRLDTVEVKFPTDREVAATKLAQPTKHMDYACGDA